MSETVLSVVIPALSNGSYDVVVTNPDGKKATLKRGLTIQDPPVTVSADKCGSLTVYFALDSSTIPAEFRSTLDSWAGCVRSADLPVRIEGHCDERGTTEYNLALGQRRADSVARYLTGMGIPKVRITAVSYGEEHAVTTGSEEGSWSKNRRAELSARP
jgi:peptidoglycan-associated lipoprotein